MMKRRGLSTVVGAVFFIIALTTTITYITYSMNLLDNFTHSFITKTSDDSERLHEEFEITQIRIDNNKFNITAQNTGDIPVKLSKLWAENKSTTDWVYKYDINNVIAPGEIIKNVGQDIELSALSTKAYEMKLVTDRGNVKKISINSVISPLYMQLHAIPSVIPPGFTTTLLFEVANNMTSDGVLTNLVPEISCNPSAGASYSVNLGPLPLQLATLENGNSVQYEWVLRVDGSDGSTVNCSANLENSVNVVSTLITLQDVGFASQSQTAIEALGLSSDSIDNSILILHQETDDVPNSNYQMYSGGTDSSGLTVALDSVPYAAWYTNTGSEDTVQVPSGTWNVTLRYHSEPLPDSLLSDPPDMIFHFAEDNPPVSDSSGNNNPLVLPPPPYNPTFGSNCDPHNSGCYTFVGSTPEYLSIPLSSDNNINDSPDSTAGWFKTSGTTKQTIFKTEGSTDYYEIAVDSAGKVVFEFKTSSSTTTTCTSQNSYNNNQWHFFAAIRNGSRSCALYVNTTDGVKVAQGGGSTDVDVSSSAFIGKDPDNSPNTPFTGSLGFIMHWDNYDLKPNEVVDLRKKNFGTMAHQVTFKIDITDDLGLNPQSIVDETVFLPFVDRKGNTNFWANDKNYTKFIPTLVSVLDTERLRLRMEFLSSYDAALGMNLRIDDAGGMASLLQVPLPNVAFGSFFEYDNSGDLTMFIQNIGNEGFWLSYAGTRVIMESLSGGTSYASLLKSVNGTNTDPDTDSIFINGLQFGELGFSRPRDPPQSQTSSGALIPEGYYRMYVNLYGYDEKGHSLSRVSFIGMVKVV